MEYIDTLDSTQVIFPARNIPANFLAGNFKAPANPLAGHNLKVKNSSSRKAAGKPK